MTEFGFSWSDIKTLKLWEYHEFQRLIIEMDEARERERARSSRGGGTAPPGMTRIV